MMGSSSWCNNHHHSIWDSATDVVAVVPFEQEPLIEEIVSVHQHDHQTDRPSVVLTARTLRRQTETLNLEQNRDPPRRSFSEIRSVHDCLAEALRIIGSSGDPNENEETTTEPPSPEFLQSFERNFEHVSLLRELSIARAMRLPLVERATSDDTTTARNGGGSHHPGEIDATPTDADARINLDNMDSPLPEEQP
uniref:Uncharacterized protein n=1 Tax=Cyclophora tenuis TaxID=216820 RepID=A0A7S1D818_CYCTE|mmetsp:Transcript_3589/g.6113  ORF Transcript_3589/g.6113 Transcript_3589/m.6113 type:complete len:194 (+) Transcript_3589:169-750(+)